MNVLTPQRVRVGDVFLLLYRVAERQAPRIYTQAEAPFDLASTGHIKTRSDIGQPLENLWRRIGLHREKNPRNGQNLDQPQIASLDQIQIDDKKRRGQTRVILQEPTDRLCRSGGVQPTVNLCCAHHTMPLFHIHRDNPNATQHCESPLFRRELSRHSQPTMTGWDRRTDSLATVHAS